jgi:CheY-like chemotaxis protein
MSSKQKRRVVLLDDEPSILKTWKAILEANDVEVTACETAQQALAAIECGGIDCLLTDYHMPDMTGIEVITRVRQISPARTIVMTGNGSAQLREAAKAAGAACVLEKPTPIAKVLDVIEKLCA